jgi:hypothetical protein
MPNAAGQTSREPVSPTMPCSCSLISRRACSAGSMSRSRHMLSSHRCGAILPASSVGRPA